MRHIKTFLNSLLFLGFLPFFAVITPYSFGTAGAQETDKAALSQQQKFQEELDTWTLRAYEGDRDAQFKVAVLYTNDQFATPDFKQAVYWYKQAARQDHVLAQYNLGHQYLDGIGVEKSVETAIEWWLKAAKLGHPLAQFNIGRAYYLGIGLNQDHHQSKFWFQQAANNKEPKSIEILKELGWDQDKQVQSNHVSAQPSQASDQSANASTTAKSDTVTQNIDSPITLYTNPKIHSFEILTLNERSGLIVIEESNPWSSVRHKEGFPVWVHGNFISTNKDRGVISGSSLNARSTPFITKGNIIDKLNLNEVVTILSQSKGWYQVISPIRFKAWVKTSDLNTSPSGNSPSATNSNTTLTPAAPITINSNEWLFSQASSNYTIQLASFDSEEKVNSFIKNTKLKNDLNLHQFTSKSKNIRWTYFLYGAYSDKEAAIEKKNNLENQQSWVRNIGKLQQNRCISWKKQIPTPKELNLYCTPKS